MILKELNAAHRILDDLKCAQVTVSEYAEVSAETPEPEVTDDPEVTVTSEPLTSEVTVTSPELEVSVTSVPADPVIQKEVAEQLPTPPIKVDGESVLPPAAKQWVRKVKPQKAAGAATAPKQPDTSIFYTGDNAYMDEVKKIRAREERREKKVARAV